MVEKQSNYVSFHFASAQELQIQKLMQGKYWYSAKEKLPVISVFENRMVYDHCLVTVLAMIKAKGVLRKLFHLILIKVHIICFNGCLTVTYTTSEFQVSHNAQK